MRWNMEQNITRKVNGGVGQSVVGSATNKSFVLFPGGRSSSDWIHGNILFSLELKITFVKTYWKVLQRNNISEKPELQMSQIRQIYLCKKHEVLGKNVGEHTILLNEEVLGKF